MKIDMEKIMISNSKINNNENQYLYKNAVFMMRLLTDSSPVIVLQDCGDSDGYYALLKQRGNIIPVPVFMDLLKDGSELIHPWPERYPERIEDFLDYLGIGWDVCERTENEEDREPFVFVEDFFRTSEKDIHFVGKDLRKDETFLTECLIRNITGVEYPRISKEMLAKILINNPVLLPKMISVTTMEWLPERFITPATINLMVEENCWPEDGHRFKHLLTTDVVSRITIDYYDSPEYINQIILKDDALIEKAIRASYGRFWKELNQKQKEKFALSAFEAGYEELFFTNLLSQEVKLNNLDRMFDGGQANVLEQVPELAEAEKYRLMWQYRLCNFKEPAYTAELGKFTSGGFTKYSGKGIVVLRDNKIILPEYWPEIWEEEVLLEGQEKKFTEMLTSCSFVNKIVPRDNLVRAFDPPPCQFNGMGWQAPRIEYSIRYYQNKTVSIQIEYHVTWHSPNRNMSLVPSEEGIKKLRENANAVYNTLYSESQEKMSIWDIPINN